MNLIRPLGGAAVEIPSPERFPDWLDERIEAIKRRLVATEAWTVMTSENTNPEILKAIMCEIYIEIAWYQKDAISGAITAIGELPRSVSPKTITSMLVHQADEFDHGLMARRDYLALGGNESRLDKANMSPSACAVAAFWNYCASRMNPFAYLGALYLFEGLTPWMSETLLPIARKAGFPSNSTEFGEFHAVEDLKHQNLVRHLIRDVATAHPESIQPMMQGNLCFEHVFPVPIFVAAYERVSEANRG